MKRLSALFLLLSLAGCLWGIVGDWEHFGPRLTLSDLRIDGEHLRAASGGGLINFHLYRERFSAAEVPEHPGHIGLRRYYVNDDGSEWFSYRGNREVSAVLRKTAAEMFLSWDSVLSVPSPATARMFLRCL
ncbi:MAG: hypothetical protein U5N26_01495 [Candidatus Marinimicrobia bacterium]|nr:hypothetical protein [Candidatus Neomarinimicrobiota bacterium]